VEEGKIQLNIKHEQKTIVKKIKTTKNQDENWKLID